MIPRLRAALVLVGLWNATLGWADTDPSSWLGLTPEAVYGVRGAPAEVYPQAVDTQRWQVVHYYADHTYLFWFQNHVWQVRADKLWTGRIPTPQPLPDGSAGIAMGTPRADVEAALGTPMSRGEGWSIWALNHQGFPRRLRLIFTDGVLSDAYFYRSEL